MTTKSRGLRPKLSDLEREEIKRLHDRGYGPNAIAAALRRECKTISFHLSKLGLREIKTHKKPKDYQSADDTFAKELNPLMARMASVSLRGSV